MRSLKLGEEVVVVCKLDLVGFAALLSQGHLLRAKEVLLEEKGRPVLGIHLARLDGRHQTLVGERHGKKDVFAEKLA